MGHESRDSYSVPPLKLNIALFIVCTEDQYLDKKKINLKQSLCERLKLGRFMVFLLKFRVFNQRFKIQTPIIYARLNCNN